MKKTRMLIHRLASAGLSAAVILGGGTAVLPMLADTAAVVQAAPAGITLDKTAFALGQGESVRINVKSGKAVSWASSDNNAVAVKGGLVTGRKNGTAVITAKTADGKTAKCTVTVKNAPSKVTIAKGVLTLGVGESYTLGSGVNDGAASSNRTYRTSSSSIVKMTNTKWTGSFTAVKVGVAYVTVRTYNGKESTCKVTVREAPSKVTLSRGLITLTEGQSASLSASVPDNAGCAKRTFRTSNAKVLQMTKTDWTGSFKAVKPGTAYVTVRTYNGKEASCKVVVNAMSGYDKLIWRMKADKARYDKASNSVIVMEKNIDQNVQKGSAYAFAYALNEKMLEFAVTEAGIEGNNIYDLIMIIDDKTKKYSMLFTWAEDNGNNANSAKTVMMMAVGKMSSLTKTSAIPFEATDLGSGYIADAYDKTMLKNGKSVGNAKAKLYMAKWDEMLYQIYGLHMSDIGFTSWK